MSNPYRPKYTVTQDARVRLQRKRLLERWNVGEFVQDQPTGFRVEHRCEEIDHDGTLIDVFQAFSASSSFTSAWDTFVRTHKFSVEHGTRSFQLRVPHAFYLNNRYLPCSIDRQCLLTIMINVVLIVILLWLSVKLGFD